MHQSPATGQGVFSELCTSFSCKAQLYCILWCSSQVSRCSNWLQPQMEIPYNKYCCQRLTITTLGMVCLREDWEIIFHSIGLEYWNYLVSIAFLSHLSELQCSNKSIEWLIAFLFVECEFADRGIEWHLKNSARFPPLSFFWWWWWEKNPTLEIPQEARSAQTLIQSSRLYVDVIIRYERSSRCLRIAGALEVSMCLIRDGWFPALRSSGLFLSTTLAALFNEFS